MRKYHIKVNPLSFTALWVRVALASLLVLLLYPIPLLIESTLSNFNVSNTFAPMLGILRGGIFTVGVSLLLVAFIILLLTPKAAQIARMARRGLFDPTRSNPLYLHENQRLPHVRCKRTIEGLYELTVSANQSVTVDTIKAAAPAISSALTGHWAKYAVVGVETDTAYNAVTFRLNNVKISHALTFASVEQMRPASPTMLRVDAVNSIDLTTSGSMLVAGKTRSGKTTGIIALLLQVLLAGPDEYDSQVIIIDPKQAELSRLPHTVTLDEDGEATAILDALKAFAKTMTLRQRVLNNLSEQKGDAVKWWDADMHPALLFIDEYVACRSIFPKKAAAKDSVYCIDTYDSILKRIITMGASAGCFVIISTAEASVQEGGLPAMLRSAMSTRILFRPTIAEGSLMWDKNKIDALPERTYGPGDAWFSSTDGKHERVSFVRFPRMEFPVYMELGRLLTEYYEHDT